MLFLGLAQESIITYMAVSPHEYTPYEPLGPSAVHQQTLCQAQKITRACCPPSLARQGAIEFRLDFTHAPGIIAAELL
jgi:hypothetical protein